MNYHCSVRGIKAWSVGAKFPIQVDLKFSIIFMWEMKEWDSPGEWKLRISWFSTLTITKSSWTHHVIRC
jgi:hypothetical protein